MAAVTWDQFVHDDPVLSHRSGANHSPRTLDHMTFLIIVAVILAAVVAWRMRVQLLAKVLGQSESRIDRQLNRKKR
jgi:hypothetical protein